MSHVLADPPPAPPMVTPDEAVPPRPAGLVLAEAQASRMVAELWSDPSLAQSLRALLAAGRGRDDCQRAGDCLTPLAALSPSPPTREEIAVEFCARFAGFHCAPGSRRERASAYSAPAALFVKSLGRYASTRWLYERTLTAVPFASAGGPHESLWTFLKVSRSGDAIPSVRHVRRWLARGDGREQRDVLATQEDAMANPMPDDSIIESGVIAA